MSDLENLSHIIAGILKGDNEIIQHNEALLKQNREADINQYIMTFANLLYASPDKGIRVFCAVHLRRHLSDFVNQQEQTHWLNLTGENQNLLKEILWNALLKEEDAPSKKVISELVGEIAATVLNLEYVKSEKCGPEGKTWDGLMPKIWGLMSSPNPALIESALGIMNVLFTFGMRHYGKYKKELLDIFNQTLNHGDLRVKGAAVDAAASFLKTAEEEDCKYFVDLMPLLLENVLFLIDNHEDKVEISP